MGDWSSIGNVSAGDLAEARVQAYHAAQWLARVARNFVPPADDDSHTALSWNSEHRALVTQPFAGASGPFSLGLKVEDISLIIVTDTANTPVPLQGHNESQVEAWVRACLLEQGADRDKALNFRPLPYEMPDHAIASSGTYGDGLADGALGELAAWFDGAATLLAEGPGKETGASPVRLWPHHFDIATLISLDESGGEDARSIGVGLSPGDETYDTPYFYVSPWPYPDKDALPELGAGHWHTEGYTAAILEAADITGGADAGAFLREAITACHNALS